MERHRRTRWTPVASALVLAAGLCTARSAEALARASITRDVGMRAGRPVPSAQSRDRARQSSIPAPSQRPTDSATNARGAAGGHAALAQHHDGRERRRAPDSRVVLDPLRSCSGRPGPAAFGKGERIVSASAAVFHDANAPPASSLDAAGRRS